MSNTLETDSQKRRQAQIYAEMGMADEAIATALQESPDFVTSCLTPRIQQARREAQAELMKALFGQAFKGNATALRRCLVLSGLDVSADGGRGAGGKPGPTSSAPESLSVLSPTTEIAEQAAKILKSALGELAEK
jgi:hypothetical protein